MAQLRYNPLMEAAIRAEEERAKAISSAYAAHSAQFRSKEPMPVPPPQHRMQPGPGGPMGMGGPMGGGHNNSMSAMIKHQQTPPPVGGGNGPGGGGGPPIDMHKKEESSQNR
jgi:hypothetical protein